MEKSDSFYSECVTRDEGGDETDEERAEEEEDALTVTVSVSESATGDGTDIAVETTASPSATHSAATVNGTGTGTTTPTSLHQLNNNRASAFGAAVSAEPSQHSITAPPHSRVSSSSSSSLNRKKSRNAASSSSSRRAGVADHQNFGGINEDAFSSSSEDNDDDDEKATVDDHRSSTSIADPSEWDKALKSGKSSKGHVIAFPEPVGPNISFDDDEHSHQGNASGEASLLNAQAPKTDTALDSRDHPIDAQSRLQPSYSSAASDSMPPTPRLRENDTGNNAVENSNVAGGVLPDVLMTMRLRLESLQLFDSDVLKLTEEEAVRQTLKRSSQQSISAAVLVSLAHKRYERRRLAAMEIEKVTRSLLAQHELDRIRAILLLLSDDYVRSTSEDARKGGVVALAACAIALKRARDIDPLVHECRDLILASVVHACQDHSSRVRYYATESLFNVVKVLPQMAVQHFFILFEILRSLYADVDADVRSGAELLDKKLKEIIVSAMNAGSFTAESCVPVFARFVYLRHKATKRLTLTWLQELNEKVLDSPIVEFLHLFLGGIFDMVADPTLQIRESAILFLHSVLPKLLVVDGGGSRVRKEDSSPEHGSAVDDDGPSSKSNQATKVDFDKILQSLVTTMEHPDPFVRKVAMYWMSRIVKAHCDPGITGALGGPPESESSVGAAITEPKTLSYKASSFCTGPPPPPPPPPPMSPASLSVRNSLPHILPGILLSIGDDYQPKSKGTTAGGAPPLKDSFLPDQTTRALAEQTNATLQAAVRRDGPAFVSYLDGFIMALREELDSPSNSGGAGASVGSHSLSHHRYPAPVERTPFRMDVKQDGTGIESPGWFSGAGGEDRTEERSTSSTLMSRLCALDWVIVLYESVVPILLKADFAREFVHAIILQLVDSPPESILYKSLEVLANITVPVPGETGQRSVPSTSLSSLAGPVWQSNQDESCAGESTSGPQFPMTETNVSFAFDILEPARRLKMSRNREMFAALITLHSQNPALLADLSKVITYMCRLQPPEFVYVSFAVELDRYLSRKLSQSKPAFAQDLKFVSSYVQNLSHVLLTKPEAKEMRNALRDCVCSHSTPVMSERDRQRSRLFHILLHSFSHNLAATVSLCFWAGAYRTTHLVLNCIDPLDINLMFLLEIDRFIELLERPLFRHLHVRMLEDDKDPQHEGSGSMLFKSLKSLLLLLPQSTCYFILRDRLVSVSRFRQTTVPVAGGSPTVNGRLDSLLHRQSLVPPGAATTIITNGCGTATNGSSGRGTSAGGDAMEVFLTRVLDVRALHCEGAWNAIRSESLEVPPWKENDDPVDEEPGSQRREWLGYASDAEERQAHPTRRREAKQRNRSFGAGVDQSQYSHLVSLDGVTAAASNVMQPATGLVDNSGVGAAVDCPDDPACRSDDWKQYWTTS